VARLVNVRPYRWDRCEEAGPGQLALTVTFWGSPHAGYCDVDRIEVVEDDDRVVVTLYVGDAPDQAGPVTLVAVEQSAAIRLGRPLAGRAVVDGAAG
jgi:hypothetical protein